MSDEKYTDTGMRGPDPRRGFGDDMGTRIGRPDGNPSTNREPVADGLEGSIVDDVEGNGQRRVQNASRSPDDELTPDPAAGDDRRVDDL